MIWEMFSHNKPILLSMTLQKDLQQLQTTEIQSNIHMSDDNQIKIDDIQISYYTFYNTNTYTKKHF